MRLLMIHHPESAANRILKIGRDQDAENVARIPTAEAERGLLVLELENPRVEPFLEAVSDIEDLGVSLLPHEVISVPPGKQPEERVLDAGPRSGVEVYLDSLQAVGRWGSFLGYAVISGVLAWSGLVTETVFLLVAAMLVAPYPNPALNTAVATARGNGSLLGRSLLRYFAALLTGVVIAYLLSVVYQIEYAGNLAHAIGSLSSVAILLPLSAGLAGGLYLTQSEKSSMVSAAAAGVLVAAALSPPVAALGIAWHTGEGALAIRSFFLLLLQIVGINLTASGVFWARGLRLRGAWYRGGRRSWAAVGWVGTIIGLLTLMSWQFGSLDLRRGSQGRDAVAVAREVVRELPSIRRFDGRASIRGEGTDALLWMDVDAHWRGGSGEREAVTETLTRQLRDRLVANGYPKPLLNITVVE